MPPGAALTHNAPHNRSVVMQIHFYMLLHRILTSLGPVTGYGFCFSPHMLLYE